MIRTIVDAARDVYGAGAMRPLFVARRLFVPAILVAFAAGSANACGGKAASQATDDVPTTRGDASTSGNAAACPEAAPESGASCPEDGLLCEYGDDFNPLCNSTFVCASSGRWARPIQPGGKATCPTPPPTPNPAPCPADDGALPSGTCTAEVTCRYATASCRCGVACPQYPVQQRPCDPDAGITTSCCDTSKIAWTCHQGPPTCTTPRPRVGAPCTKEGDSCAIDEAAECGQTVMQCRDGVWNLGNTQCPISSAKAKREIAYLGSDETARLHDELMAIRLATYRYKTGDDSRHLGFLIEDMPEGSPAVLASRDRVDLYGYASMTVAALQRQQREIDALRAEVRRLAADNAALSAGRRRGASSR